MNHLWFCGVCERVAVPHSGDTCVRCNAVIEAVINPDQRQPLKLAPPLGVRFLHWLTGRTTA